MSEAKEFLRLYYLREEQGKARSEALLKEWKKTRPDLFKDEDEA